MQPEALSKLPLRVKIQELISSHYESGQRPLSWDKRKAGIDIVRTTDGKVIKLESDGGQSPPQKNWTILISNGNADSGYSWTLYGI